MATAAFRQLDQELFADTVANQIAVSSLSCQLQPEIFRQSIQGLKAYVRVAIQEVAQRFVGDSGFPRDPAFRFLFPLNESSQACAK